MGESLSPFIDKMQSHLTNVTNTRSNLGARTESD